jgi:hypothetical protein
MVVLAWLALGCGGRDPVDTDGTDTADTSDDTGVPGTTDEDLVRGLIAGERTLSLVLSGVAWSDGFPVATDDGTYLFVREGSGDVEVAGDFDGWVGVPMTDGDGFLWAEVEITDPQGQKYKFVEGASWEPDPWARSYGYDEFDEYSLVEPPADEARLDRWPDFPAEALDLRDVRVLVPAGVGPWPVLYVHDGQNLFDPEAFWGGWHLQDAVAAVGGGILVVGVDNTADRMSEYVHVDDVISGTPITAAGDAYADLAGRSIRGWVESEYGSTGLDGVMGSSLGGLISLYTAHRDPAAWDFAASLSGTLGWGRFGATNPTMEELFVAEGHRGFVIYVDSGGDDGGDGCDDVDGDGAVEDDPNDADNYCTNRAFADAMAASGYAYEVDLFHWWEPGATHDEAAWAARVEQPLGIFVAME